MLPKPDITRNRKLQNILFFIACVCNALPLLLVQYFPTVDGPAHIYNAQLLKELIQGNELVKTFHELNPAIVPNWSATILLVLLRSFLPVFIVEKIMVAVYVIGLPIAFRKLLQAIKPDANAPWLILPFTYTFMLFMGFYNFNLGMVIFFFALASWIRNYENPKPKHFIALFLYGGLLYFSHIFVFGAYILCLGIYGIFRINRNNVKKSVIRILSIMLVLLPWIILTSVFILTKSGSQKTYISFRDHILQLRSMSLLITFNYKDVENFTKTIFYVIFILSITTVLLRLIRSNKQGLLHKNDTWLFTSVVFLLIYFIMPDADGSSGYMSVRIALMFFIFLVLWISLQEMPRWMRIVPIVPILVVHGFLLNYYIGKLKEYNPIIAELKTIETKTEDHKILLPVNNSNEWYSGHFSNYLGASKDIIVLENYEAETRYFPLLWNKRKIPNLLMGDADNKSLSLNWISNSSNPVQQIDYVLIVGNDGIISKDDFYKLRNALNEFYSPIYSFSNIELYVLKK